MCNKGAIDFLRLGWWFWALVYYSGAGGALMNHSCSIIILARKSQFSFLVAQCTILPTLHAVFFFNEGMAGPLLRVWVGERIGYVESYTAKLKIKIIWNVYAINYTSLKGGRNIHFLPVSGYSKWIFLTTFIKYARNVKFSLQLSHKEKVPFHAWVEKSNLFK